MPEGDSLHRLARTLRPTFVDQRVISLSIRSQGDDLICDEQVTAIDALGKHLLIAFGSGQTLRVHLGMHGRAQVLPRARCSPRLSLSASCVLFGEDYVLAVFRANTAELLRTGASVRRAVSHLGPDLLADEVDYETILERLDAPAQRIRPIGEVLMDQRVACGIGNVYKSEALFAAGLHPQTPVRLIPLEQRKLVYTQAAELMAKNLGSGPRVTRPGMRPLGGYRAARSTRYFVYMRGSQPCIRCGTTVRRIYQGDQARSTYFCPTCQPSELSEQAVVGPPT